MSLAESRPLASVAVSTGAPNSSVSWPAVWAGAVVAAAVTAALLVLASAVGLTLVSPWSGANASATTFVMSGAIGLIVVQWLSSGLGGYVAGRLRTRWADVDSDEVFFRDTAHGLLVWCVATLFVVSAATMAAGGAARLGAQAAGAATGAAATVGEEASGYLVDSLYRGAPAQASAEVRGETTRIVLSGLSSGDIPQADRAYLAQLVASRANISPEDAQRRVSDAVTAAQSAKAKAQEIADQARKAAQRTALFAFLSMLIGAFIACAAAAFGGSLRDA